MLNGLIMMSMGASFLLRTSSVQVKLGYTSQSIISCRRALFVVGASPLEEHYLCSCVIKIV